MTETATHSWIDFNLDKKKNCQSGLQKFSWACENHQCGSPKGLFFEKFFVKTAVYMYFQRIRPVFTQTGVYSTPTRDQKALND